MKPRNLFFFVVVASTLALPTLSTAKVIKLEGSREQVRAACKEQGGRVIESPTTTICMNDDKGTAIECDNDGKCFGTAPGRQIGKNTLPQTGGTTSTKTQQ